MKTVKRALALVLALTMLLAMSATVFAADETTYTITINNTTTGHTYKAYQIFAGDLAEKDGKTILSNITWGNGITEAGKTTLGDAAKKTETLKTADDAAAFAKAVAPYLQNPTTSVEETGKYTISRLKAGYYLVKDTQAPADDFYSAYIMEVVSNVEAKPKGDKPTIDKNIRDNNETVKANEASIGDAVNYEITSKVPNMTGYNKYFFVLNDTLSKGLTFNNDVKVKIGETELAADAYSVTPTTNRDGTTSVKIVLNNFINYQEKNGQTILVTYSATLNQNAEVGTTPNTNTVKLVYSNDPNHTYTGENEPAAGEPTGETPEIKTETYTTELTITKTDGNGQILTGAEFTLTGNSVNIVLVSESTFSEDANGTYWKLKNGTYTTTEPTAENQASYDSTETKYSKSTTLTAKGIGQAETSVKGFVDDAGKITFRGLGAGEYTLTETVTPAGYNTIAPITFTISFDKETKKFSTNNENISVGADNTLSTTIVNNAGAELPSTGGIGTTIFYVLGGLLVVCAGVLLITKRRMNNNA